jgi:hypothetical protein
MGLILLEDTAIVEGWNEASCLLCVTTNADVNASDALLED